MPRLLHLTSVAWLVAMAVVPDAGAAEGSGEAPLDGIRELGQLQLCPDAAHIIGACAGPPLISPTPVLPTNRRWAWCW